MTRDIEAVIKVGGSLARHPGLAEALRPLRALHDHGPVLVVPGGGPFADSVREAALRHELDDSTTHWMSVAAMDQFAHVLTHALDAARVVARPREIRLALQAGRVPVLAPLRWLRHEDPLPHSAFVTADSIAAWVARRLGVARLIVVKSAPDRAEVDDYFAVASAGLDCEVVVPTAAGWRRIA